MTKKDIKQRIGKLKKEISHHRYLYHVLDAQELSDAALDSLKHELFLLEQENPEFITPDSPTQRVGGKPLSKFKKVEHKERMLSLEDAFSREDMEDWEKRIKKVFPQGKYNYFGELKIDGFAISLLYKNGILSIASTRGDGLVGEDVTQNIKTVESVPLKLSFHKSVEKINDLKLKKYKNSLEKLIEKGEVEVRGEVYMSKKVFEDINKERAEKGEALYANPRNTAAGSIRQLDPSVAASRKLEFLAYALVTDFGQKEHKDEHEMLSALGFKTDKDARDFKELKDLEDFWGEIMRKREKLDYQIDGLVISVNDNKTKQKLGVVGKAPRGSIAFKFPAEEATTVVEDVVVQVGRTGTLTPVAHLKPVSIGGTMVSRASLHNEDEIKRLGLKVGDTVVVQRAGDVIPKVTGVFKKLRTGKEKAFHLPKFCPACDSKVVKKEGEVASKCLNKKCLAKNIEALQHFTSKKAFDISGLGPKILEKLSDDGLISDSADIFSLEEAELEPMERFAEKSASNLVKAIAEKKEIPLAKFIYSLGILHVGEETALVLAKKVAGRLKGDKVKVNEIFLVFEDFSLEELEEISDIGPRVSGSIFSYFHDRHNKNLFKKMNEVGILVKIPKIDLKKQIFSDKVFVVTGELENLTRDEIKEKVRDLGGGISSSVSKKTDFVVVGEKPGSKYEKAKKIGVKILTEKEFLKMIN